jgi:hypothetical protein
MNLWLLLAAGLCTSETRAPALESHAGKQVGKLTEHARKLLGFSAEEEDMRASTWLI